MDGEYNMAYLKQIEGVTAPVRVDNKPSYGSYVKTSATDNREVYKDGEWYEETGGELVTNGTFDTDVSGWTALDNCTIEYSSGSLLATRTANSGSRAFIQNVPTSIGVKHTVRFDLTLGTASIIVVYANGVELGRSLTNNSYSFVAGVSSTEIKFFISGVIGDTATFDNISVFKSSPTLSTLPLPPQSYIEDSNGQLVEFEVIDGQVVDTHTAGYVPAIVENKVVAKEVSADSYAWANDGIDYVDEDAIGSNPVAKLYPDGTIVGSTGNGSYTKYPNGELEARVYTLGDGVATSSVALPVDFSGWHPTRDSVITGVFSSWSSSYSVQVYIDYTLPVINHVVVGIHTSSTGAFVAKEAFVVVKGRWK